LFLSYFKGGIEYLEGGIDSGFNHVEKVHKKRLLHLKGKRNVRVREVPISASSLNKGDGMDSSPLPSHFYPPSYCVKHLHKKRLCTFKEVKVRAQSSYFGELTQQRGCFYKNFAI
jgi:hypothetical protein